MHEAHISRPQCTGGVSAEVFTAADENKSKDIYDDPRLLETLAELIGKEMTAIYDWLQNVPPPLCNARKGGGEPFSTNRDTLNLSQFISPIWLERQRLLLELHYHHFMIFQFCALLYGFLP